MENSSKRILVVEDEEGLREMLKLIFSEEGYEVDTAVNGKQAWDLLNFNQYDLLATDLYMPVMNGIDLIIQTQAAFPEMNIIMLSGGGKEVEVNHGNKVVKYLEQEVTVDMFLKKPFDLNELLDIVEKLVAA